MSKTLKVLGLTVLFVGFATIGLASSHEEPEAPIYVWISELKAKPGQGDALVQLLKKDAEILDPLVESGAAAEWGIAMPATHSGGDSGIRYQWVAYVGWAGADQFMQAFMSNMQAMSEDERKAMAAEWETVVEPGSHADTINRSVHVGAGRPGRTSYIHVSYRTAKRGKGGDAMKFYKENVAPVYDQLIAAGAILNYGLHVPEVHQGETWTHMGWIATESLAARDAARAAFDAQISSSPEEIAKWQNAMMDLFEVTPYDQILVVVHHKTASGDGE